ncbi:hypothetical protein BDV19DRAFT_205825 [Aspergillus venezuelensis]
MARVDPSPHIIGLILCLVGIPFEALESYPTQPFYQTLLHIAAATSASINIGMSIGGGCKFSLCPWPLSYHSLRFI